MSERVTGGESDCVYVREPVCVCNGLDSVPESSRRLTHGTLSCNSGQ